MHIHMYVCNGYFGTCSCRIITSYMQWSTSPAEQHVFSSSSVCAHTSSLPPGSRPLHFGENTIAGPEQTAHSHTIFVYLTSDSMTSWIWMVRIMQRVAFTPMTKRPACIRSISTVAIKGVQNQRRSKSNFLAGRSIDAAMWQACDTRLLGSGWRTSAEMAGRTLRTAGFVQCSWQI